MAHQRGQTDLAWRVTESKIKKITFVKYKIFMQMSCPYTMPALGRHSHFFFRGQLEADQRSKIFIANF